MATVAASIPNGQFLDEGSLNVEKGAILPADRQIDWSPLIEKMSAASPDVVSRITKKVLNVHPEREAFQLFGVLTPDECTELIAATESVGFQAMAGYDQDYRTNTRRIIVYEKLERVIWERIESFMTSELENTFYPPRRETKRAMWERIKDLITSAPSKDAEPAYQPIIATWKAYGLNPQFRFCRYEPGQKFAAHYDSNYAINPQDASFYTFMIYLNGGSEGGNTNFLSDTSNPPRGRVLESLAPEPGMLLVFRHRIYHEGEQIRSGVKYIMRTDIMYRVKGAKISSEANWKEVGHHRSGRSRLRLIALVLIVAALVCIWLVG